MIQVLLPASAKIKFVPQIEREKLDFFLFNLVTFVAVKMGLKPSEDKRPSKLAIMDDDDVSDKPSE